MIKGTSTGCEYKCDVCLTPCVKADKPVIVGPSEYWELCDKCKERMKIKIKQTETK